MKFDNFNLSEPLLRAIKDRSYTDATPIQVSAIPAILSKRDVMAQSQTGSGKTAAFTIPLIENTLDTSSINTLVISHTRELALQISDEFKRLCKYRPDIKIGCVYGGSDIRHQIKTIKNGLNILVGCPGRLLDLINKRVLKLDSCSCLVLDEADEMLSMGFKEDIDLIIKHMPLTRQTLLFSATLSKEIKEIANKYLVNPINISGSNNISVSNSLTQEAYMTYQKDKKEVLVQILELETYSNVMIFCNTKKMVEDLNKFLLDKGYNVGMLHGDMKQETRSIIMKRFKLNQIKILICTDVAARGIDVDNLSLVINFDLPQDSDYYIHRIGRSGRSKNKGLSITLFTPKEKTKIKTLEKITKKNINIKKLPDTKDLNILQEDKIFNEIKSSLTSKSHPIFSNVIYRLNNAGIDTNLILNTLITKIYGNKILKEVKEEKLPPLKSKSPKKTDICIKLGKKDKVTVNHIVCALTEDLNIDGKSIGKIKITNEVSKIGIGIDIKNQVIKRLKKIKIKNKSVKII